TTRTARWWRWRRRNSCQWSVVSCRVPTTDNRRLTTVEGRTPMPQVAFLFPGQGAQAVGMGRELREALPAARRLFDEAAELLGYDLADVCANGPAERLNSTAVSQPALFVTSLAALE